MWRVVYFLTCCFLVIASCCASRKAPGSVEVQRGVPFELAIGQSVSLPGSACQLAFVGIAEDSRCPKEVDCFWEGQVVVEIEISSSGNFVEMKRIIYRADKADPPAIGCGNQKIALRGVMPYPERDQKIAPAAYRTRWVVE